MDDNADNEPKTPGGGLPKMRPYQIPAAQQKARDEKEAAERQERIDELRKESEGLQKPKVGFGRRLLHFMGWMLLIVVLTGAIGGAGYWYFLKPKTTDTPAASDQKTTQTSNATSPAAIAAAPTKHYESTNFGLAFDYPEAWIVTDNSIKLTVVSPPLQLKDTTGSRQNAQITTTIQNKQASTPAFKSGNAVAVRESEKIAYAKPSQTQRANSYLSFLNYAGSTSKGLDGIYVTGDNGYQLGQAIPQVDIAKADPLITVTFSTCSDSKCATSATGKALTLNGSIWDDTAFSKPIKSMLQSIVVQ